MPAQQKLTPEKVTQLTGILRLMGALLMIAGAVTALDLGGLATAIGLNDGSDDSLHQAIGGVFVIVGLVDFFLMPVVFKKLADKGLNGT